MPFDIRLISQSFQMKGLVNEEPRPAAKGRITLGRFFEDFYTPLDVWGCEDYERQWRDSLERLANGATSSCFVVSVHPAPIARFLECWFVWRLECEYRVQNQCFFFDDTGAVDPHNPYDAIWPYSNKTEEGERIHDWILPIDTFVAAQDKGRLDPASDQSDVFSSAFGAIVKFR